MSTEAKTWAALWVSFAVLLAALAAVFADRYGWTTTAGESGIGPTLAIHTVAVAHLVAGLRLAFLVVRDRRRR